MRDRYEFEIRFFATNAQTIDPAWIIVQTAAQTANRDQIATILRTDPTSCRIKMARRKRAANAASFVGELRERLQLRGIAILPVILVYQFCTELSLSRLRL